MSGSAFLNSLSFSTSMFANSLSNTPDSTSSIISFIDLNSLALIIPKDTKLFPESPISKHSHFSPVDRVGCDIELSK